MRSLLLPRFIISTIVMTMSLSLCGQSGVRFMTGSLEGVKSVAAEKNMNLLIDTYASWCIPCKRMDKVFNQKEVADFFNENYITYKVNMDGPYGADVKAEFQVVFLPTIIIVGPDGTVKYKVDHEMSGSELVSVGRLAMQEGIQIASDATAVRINGEPAPRKAPKKVAKPSKRSNTPSTSTTKDDKIVYVIGLDGLEEPNQDYLKKEAYFRLELMDGSHRAAAQKYLDTQQDWNTKENMRFILDFVNTPNSPMYNHIIGYKQAYYDAFTKEQVDNALQILVYKHLFKGIPRPNMEEAIQLYKDLDYPTPNEYAEKYFMVRYKSDRMNREAYDMSYHYLSETNPQDDVALGQFYDYLAEENLIFDPTDLIKAAALLDNAQIPPAKKLLLEAKVIKLYIKADDCDTAKKMMKQVQKSAKESNTNVPELATININCGA